MSVTDDATNDSHSRRAFLAASGLSAVALAAGTNTATAAGPGTSADNSGFAVITDTHENIDKPELAQRLKRILAEIEARNPAFVLNCGDITDVGSEDEFAIYRDCIPSGLADRMHEVPGNHEEQWNVDAMEAYRRVIGPTHYSFDAAGVHVVALDPLVPYEADYWHYGRELLAWLKRDLAAVPAEMPIILFQHFPVVTEYRFVTDEDEFMRLIAEFNVRVIFAGHIHKTTVTVCNGVTEVTGKAVKNEPYYYWVDQITDATGDALVVSEVLLPEDTPPVSTELVTIPLSRASAGGGLGPFTTSLSTSEAHVSVNVQLPSPDATSVIARPYPQGGPVADWTPLVHADQTWSGTVDASQLPPGSHRLEIRAIDPSGAYYYDTADFALPTTDVKRAWSKQLPGRVQGALASRDGLVIAATTEGYVQSFRPTSRAPRTGWRVRVGPVFKAPVFGADGSRILVPSADHHVHALKSSNGRHLWKTDLGAPVLSEIALIMVDGEEKVCVAAGHDVVLINADGSIAWRTDIGGIFGGRAASNGELVFVGSGDSFAHALDLRTGKEVWTAPMTERTGSYFLVAYAAWASHIQLLPDDGVLFTTYNYAYSLDAKTGTQRWITEDIQTQLMYTAPAVTEQGILLFNGSKGSAQMINTETGVELWSSEVLTTSFGAAPVPTGDPNVWWMVGNSGLLVRIQLTDQWITKVLQVSTSFTFSTAVLLDPAKPDLMIVGGQDGGVHAITGLKKFAPQ